MSYFQTPGDTVPAETQPEEQTEPRTPSSWLLDFRERVAGAFGGFERGRIGPPALEPGEEPDELMVPEALEPDLAARFPVGAFGYNRAAVDHYIAELERELSELRSELPGGMSISEEIERLGEQTASILVVAHDQAHQTTRRAQEQADRCIADAASNAVSMTEQAKRHLRDLDAETDAVWQERSRLLEDARGTGSALIALAQEAAERFPEDTKATFEADPLPS